VLLEFEQLDAHGPADEPLDGGGSMAQRDLEDARQRREYDKEYTKALIGEAGSAGAAGEIERAKALLDSGAINQAEFDTLKAKALS